MSVHIKIFDGSDSLLDQIALISRGQALDALDYAGSKIREAQRKAFRASVGHDWHQRIENGKRIVYRGGPATLGKRLNWRKAGPDNMDSMINSYLMEKSMTMVVGGMHKAFSAQIRRDGQVVGRAKRIGQVLHGSYQILAKLNYGGSWDQLDPDYKRLTRRKKSRMFPRPVYRKRLFIEKGRADSMGEVQDIMTKKLASMIGKQANRVAIKYKETHA